jgi:hypothetical protein
MIEKIKYRARFRPKNQLSASELVPEDKNRVKNRRKYRTNFVERIVEIERGLKNLERIPTSVSWVRIRYEMKNRTELVE